MAAKPRVTVRLAPSTLHALAYLAERDGYAPAEVAREILAAGVAAILKGRGWSADQQDQWRAWLAEQGARPGRYESPEQGDYDALAAGLAFPASPLARAGEPVMAAAAPGRPGPVMAAQRPPAARLAARWALGSRS